MVATKGKKVAKRTPTPLTPYEKAMAALHYSRMMSVINRNKGALGVGAGALGVLGAQFGAKKVAEKFPNQFGKYGKVNQYYGDAAYKTQQYAAKPKNFVLDYFNKKRKDEREKKEAASLRKLKSRIDSFRPSRKALLPDNLTLARHRAMIRALGSKNSGLLRVKAGLNFQK